MRTLLHLIRNYWQAALLKTLWLGLRKHCRCLVVFPNVHVYAAPSSNISGNGLLALGKTWKGLRYMPSEFSLGEGARLEVHGRFNIRPGFHLAVNRGGQFSLGSGDINSRATIDCFESIRIGQGVEIGKGVTIRDSDNHYINDTRKASAPIVIEDHVWVGVNVTILKGVTIGGGSVVAAGAVVTRSIPPACLAGGVPARVIKQNITWQKSLTDERQAEVE